MRVCPNPKDKKWIGRNQAAWFKAKGVERPARTVLAVQLLYTDANTFEICEVMVASALICTASLGEEAAIFEGYGVD